jgi:hypothetical protein
MMPADLVYALSGEGQRAALNGAHRERTAGRESRQRARASRTRARTS